jgi:hypothetical protein
MASHGVSTNYHANFLIICPKDVQCRGESSRICHALTGPAITLDKYSEFQKIISSTPVEKIQQQSRDMDLIVYDWCNIDGERDGVGGSWSE